MRERKHIQVLQYRNYIITDVQISFEFMKIQQVVRQCIKPNFCFFVKTDETQIAAFYYGYLVNAPSSITVMF